MLYEKTFFESDIRVLTAIILGVWIGHFYPTVALMPILENPIKLNLFITTIEIKTTFAEFLSSLFISIIKIFINPIIFLTITLGIASMSDLKKAGKVGAKALLYFEIVTTFALLIGIGAAWIIQPGEGVATPTTTGDISTYTNRAADFSWLHFLKDNVTIQVVLIAIVAGLRPYFSILRLFRFR